MSNGFSLGNGRRGVRPLILTVAMVLGVLSIVLHVLTNNRAASVVGLVAAWLLLYGSNFEFDERHRQWIFPVAALSLCIFWLVIVVWLQANFDSFMRGHSTLLNWLGSIFNLRLPQNFGEALQCLNMLLIVLMGVLKLSIAAGIHVIRTFFKPDAGMLNSITKYGVYDFFPTRGWRLISKWVYVRHFCCAMTFSSAFALVALLLTSNGTWSFTWLPLLPASGVLIFGEIAAYLGGRSGEMRQFEFEGGEVGITPFGNYEQVWKSMRQVWPESWLAASNQDMWGDK